MNTTKHPFGRYQIIDRELRRKDWVKTKEFKRIIKSDLGIDVSEKMINNDLIAMRDSPMLSYYAPIDYNHSEKAYYYTDDNYTITAFGLKDGDINALKFYANTLNQYKEYEVFKDFSNAIEKVLDAVNIRSGITNIERAKSVVQTEQTPSLTGSSLIPSVVQALNENKIIKFDYQKFDDDISRSVKLEPYLLKEDRHRWYIIGKLDSFPDPTRTYALDRILSIEILEDKFEPTAFNYENYYANSFGITVPDSNAIEVVLSFTPVQGKYLKTLKIHATQSKLIDDENEFRISIQVKPSWEFYEKILGYGPSVKILSPASVIQEFNDKIKLMAEYYK